MLWCPQPAWIGDRASSSLAITALLEMGSILVSRAEVLRVGFNKAPLPSSACSVPKEVSTKASEAIWSQQTYVLSL